MRKTLKACSLLRTSRRKPETLNLVADKAYAFPYLAELLWKKDHVRLIAPKRIKATSFGANISRAGQKLPKEIGWQNLRRQRRNKKRWIVERFFSWLKNYRRIVNRWEYYAENFMGMVYLACCLIVLKHF